MAKTVGVAFGNAQRIERQRKAARNKLYKEVVSQGQEAIEELTASVQNIKEIIDGLEGVGTKKSYTFSLSNPDEAQITIEGTQAVIVLPNITGNRELFVQVTENSASNELISAYVGITESSVTLALPASEMQNGQQYTAVIFG